MSTLNKIFPHKWDYHLGTWKELFCFTGQRIISIRFIKWINRRTFHHSASEQWIIFSECFSDINTEMFKTWVNDYWNKKRNRITQRKKKIQRNFKYSSFSSDIHPVTENWRLYVEVLIFCKSNMNVETVETQQNL